MDILVLKHVIETLLASNKQLAYDLVNQLMKENVRPFCIVQFLATCTEEEAIALKIFFRSDIFK